MTSSSRSNSRVSSPAQGSVRHRRPDCPEGAEVRIGTARHRGVGPSVTAAGPAPDGDADEIRVDGHATPSPLENAGGQRLLTASFVHRDRHAISGHRLPASRRCARRSIGSWGRSHDRGTGGRAGSSRGPPQAGPFGRVRFNAPGPNDEDLSRPLGLPGLTGSVDCTPHIGTSSSSAAEHLSPA